mmetsp:Transcript_25647/g.64447  ORF Transcript_25647/g.64447 Transcript_25647/m.64447 type:complete len:202 (-) Transcript_25647:207-812(-)
MCSGLVLIHSEQKGLHVSTRSPAAFVHDVSSDSEQKHVPLQAEYVLFSHGWPVPARSACPSHSGSDKARNTQLLKMRRSTARSNHFQFTTLFKAIRQEFFSVNIPKLLSRTQTRCFFFPVFDPARPPAAPSDEGDSAPPRGGSSIVVFIKIRSFHFASLATFAVVNAHSLAAQPGLYYPLVKLAPVGQLLGSIKGKQYTFK